MVVPFVIVLSMLSVLPMGIGAAGSSRDEIRSSVREIFDEDDYQSELPVAVDTPPSNPFLEWLIRLLRLQSVGDVMRWVFFLAAVAVLVFLCIAAVNRWSPPPRSTADATRETTVGMSERPVGDAAHYADRGEYARAIHILLLRTIEEIRSQLRYDPADSLTSREILARAPLPAASQRLLDELITRVEVHYFGTRPPQRSDYEVCVDTFHAARRALGARSEP